MAKEIVPHKVIVTLNPDWTVQSGLLSYRVKEDGAMDAKKYFTMDITSGVSPEDVAALVNNAKDHVEKGEKIK